MPLLPHKNVFLLKFINKYMNIRFCYFCSLSTCSCRSWWFAIISSCRSFIYDETYKHDNYIHFCYFYNQFTFNLHVMTFYNYFLIEMVVLLWNYQKLPSIILFGNDLPLVAKLIICHYSLIKLFFCLKIRILFFENQVLLCLQLIKLQHCIFIELCFRFFVSKLISLGMN
jgi:hypothetical protein